MYKEVNIENNNLYIFNKKLPTSINEFIGEIVKIDDEYIYMNVIEINDYCIEKNFKKLKGTPNKDYEKLKFKRSFNCNFLDVKVKDYIRIRTYVAMEKDNINEEGLFNIFKTKSLTYKIL